MRQLAKPSEVHLNNAQSNAERCNEVDLRAAMAVFTTADGAHGQCPSKTAEPFSCPPCKQNPYYTFNEIQRESWSHVHKCAFVSSPA